MPPVRFWTITRTYRNTLSERQTWNRIHACHFVQWFESAIVQCFFPEWDHQCLACLDLLLLKFNSGMCWDSDIHIYDQLNANTSLNHVKLSGHLFLDPSVMSPGWSAISAYHSTHPAMLKAPADCKAHGKFHFHLNHKQGPYQIKCIQLEL